MSANQNMVITGGAGGIALPLIKMLLEDNRYIMAIDSNKQALDKLNDIYKHEKNLEFIHSSLENYTDCVNALSSVKRIYGLIHLAGMFIPDAMNEADTESVFDPVINSNLRTAYNITSASLPKFERPGPGRIVLTSSVAFTKGSPDHTAYSAAKGGIVGMVRSLARRLSPNILVNCVAPGIIDTKMPAKMIRKRGLDNVLSQIPIGRLGKPEEVASVILFLLGPDASYINAQTINVDGGMMPS